MSANPPDMLFIDSAGASTIKNNADLMVKRGRYPALPLPLAAMALYTLQAFAPSGGMGNRVSMRGGGPMVTLMQPLNRGEHALWRLVWINVPEGTPLSSRACQRSRLPWLRPTRTSEGGESVTPESSHRAEAFFGMPRRLRLMCDGGEGTVTGVVQKPYGTRYQLWQHPLSPYYRVKPGAELLPVHPKPGRVSYRNWLGIAFGQNDKTRMPAESVRRFPGYGQFAGRRNSRRRLVDGQHETERLRHARLPHVPTRRGGRVASERTSEGRQRELPEC